MHEQRFDPRPARAPLTPPTNAWLAGVCAAALALSACGGGSPSGGPGAGGSSGGSSNPSGAAGDGAGGDIGGVAGTTGSGGSAAGGAGNAAGGTGGNGATAGSGGGAAGGGNAGRGGATGAAGSAGNGGRGGTTGNAGNGGTAGNPGNGGNGGNGGTTGGGAAGRGGGSGAGGTAAGGRGGATGSAGATGAGGTSATTCTVPAATRCTGAMAPNPNPFGCTFAWGRQSPSGTGALSGYNYLQMVANWVEPGVRADGTYSSCSGCSWLTSRVAGSNLIPVYYAYMIGYYGHANNLPDQNTNPNGANLSTGGAALIKANRAKIIQLYTKYAQDTYAVWKTKPLVWFLEGDFIQYTASSQGSPLTMQELGQLAADITCAIKSNMPNAVVAINHTTWNADDQTNSFWCEMKRADYDLVWTTGVGNNGNFIESAGAPGYYNATTATYPYVHALTGKTIAVDTSYGASGMSDSWSNQTAAALNNHIMNGVIGVNISTNPPSNYQTLIQNIGQLSTTCR